MSEKNPLAAFFENDGTLWLDGALATELERRGADLNDPLWSAKILIERPQLIRAVHLDYFLAGADLATTATYQATFEAFARRGLSHTAAQRLMLDAVALASAARDEFWRAPAHWVGRLRPLVAASIGPYGAMLADGSEYRGEYAVSDQELRDFHRPRLELLARSGADLLACETIPCLREALVLARLLEEVALPGWISFSCRDAVRNCVGEDVADCARALDGAPQVVALGLNCTAPQFAAPLLRRMRPHTSTALLAYPNSGERYDALHRCWQDGTEVASFAQLSREWRAAGARLVGGCCRTTPADIAALRA
jgi:homocysteine S-methyltransferase